MAKRHTEKLTVKRIEKLTAVGRHSDGAGLALQISKDKNGEPTGRSWILRYEVNGHERIMGLGSLTDCTLKEAREEARKYRQMLRRDGIDPVDFRKAERLRLATDKAKMKAETRTFKEAAEEFFKFHSKNWSIKHAEGFKSTMGNYVYPIIGGLPCASIDNVLVISVLRPIWQDINQTARRIRRKIENILDFARVNGWRKEGENPATWKGNLKHVLSAPGLVTKVKNFAALPYEQIPDFMTRLRARHGVAAKALEFTILTAARSGESLAATWNEIDLEQKLWTIPAERMKAGKQHIVPLSDRALTILKSLPRESDYLFPGSIEGEAISEPSMRRVLERMEYDVTVHGMRSTFDDWAGDRTSFDKQSIDFALAHGVTDQTEAAYRRRTAIEKRSRLMAAWAGYCGSVPVKSGSVPVESGTVIPMQQGRRK